MKSIQAFIRNGRIETNTPIDLPDGALVLVTEVPQNENEETPEEIATAVAAMLAMEPVLLTAAECDALETERHARKVWEKQHFLEYAEPLRRLANAEVPVR